MAPRADQPTAERSRRVELRAARAFTSLAAASSMLALSLGACVEVDPVVVVSGYLLPPRLPPHALPLAAPLIELRALGTTGEVIATGPIAADGQWRLVLPVGSRWRLDVGTTDPRDSIVVNDGASNVPLEIEVCSATGQVELLELFTRAECRDGPRCAMARADLAACTTTTPCRDAQAALDVCLGGRITTCGADERILFECQARGTGEDCLRERTRYETCLAENECSAQERAVTLACEVPCAGPRSAQAELCDRGEDPCQATAVSVESGGGEVRIGCGSPPAERPDGGGG